MIDFTKRTLKDLKKECATKKPVRTLTIKKKINNELFIEKQPL